jgi:hypothetical protein
MLLIYSKGKDNTRGRLREAINRKEKGVLSLTTRIRYNYNKVINLSKD